MTLAVATPVQLYAERTWCLLLLLQTINNVWRVRCLLAHLFIAKGIIMALPSPPGTNPPRLLVLRFLDTHLQHGGLDQNSYSTLCKMVRIMIEIGRKLFPPSHILRENVRKAVEWYASCVLEGCDHFCRIYRVAVIKAQDATDRLPLLGDVPDELLYERMRGWRETLQTLHEPTGNDTRLYRHMSNCYSDHVYLPFLTLHQREPEHPAWCLYQHLTAIHLAIDLHHLCRTADYLVKSLDAEFKEAKRKHKRTLPNLEKVTSHELRSQELSPIKETAEPAYKPRPKEFTTEASMTIDSSFSAVDEQLAHLNRVQESPLQARSYTTAPEGSDGGLYQPRPVYAARVPSVFAGASEQPESGSQKVSLDTEREQDERSEGPTRIKDFAISTPRMLPSPATLLERREATKTQEVEWQERVINGKLFRSRRPSTRGRSQTIDDRNGLRVWLEQERTPPLLPALAGRLSMLQRKNTM